MYTFAIHFEQHMKNLLWIVGVAVVIVVLLSWGRQNEELSISEKSNRELVLTCEPGGMAENFHIHPQLKIVMNDTEYTIPQNIGITSYCIHPLHTHTDLPNIHIEAPEKRDFTLGDFFAVWKQPFSKDTLMGYTADNTHTITMTVNGVSVDSFENTILRDKDQIVIRYQSI